MGDVTPLDAARPRALEFFAGIGLARMGMEAAGFRVAWANDYEPDKKAMYDAQFGETDGHSFALGDIARVLVSDLPRDASPVRVVNRCKVTGRRHAYIRKFNVSRLVFREMALNGLIPGVTKASW